MTSRLPMITWAGEPEQMSLGGPSLSPVSSFSTSASSMSLTASRMRRSRLGRTVNHLAAEPTTSLQEEFRKKHPMRGDSLMHVCHLHQSQACWNIEKVLEF